MPRQSSTAELCPAPSPPHTQIPPQTTPEGQISKSLSPPGGHEAPTHDATVGSNLAPLEVPTTFEHSISPENSSSLDPDEKPSGTPNKKRKLATDQQEDRVKAKSRKGQVKEEKENEKLEKKVAMEEKRKMIEDAKKKRDDEKRRKDEERAEAQRQKDEYKRRKDEEKAKKDQEIAKKERAQTRLSSFFGKPRVETSATASSKVKLLMTPSEPCLAEVPAQVTPAGSNQLPVSDYERFFHPFFVKKHVTVAPAHSFSRDSEYKEYLRSKLDQYLAAERSPTRIEPINDMTKNENLTDAPSPSGTKIADLLHLPYHKRCRRGKVSKHTVKQLLGLINTSEAEHNVKAARSVGQIPPSYYLGLLNALPTKHLNFWDDVRPPYTGTFTRLPPENSGLRKGRNPFQKCLPLVDYDYPSDEEWLVPDGEEDGEELLSEPGDEEEDLEDEEDMDDFLDDEDDEAKRRSGALCPLLPFSSGLCWENSQGRNGRNDLHNMRMSILLDGVHGPINPFCTSYWLQLPRPWSDTGNAASVVVNPTLSGPSSSLTSLPHRGPNPNSALPTIRKQIPAEDLEAFKRAVNGSFMTKAGLVELLKKQFPKTSKDAIRETLGAVAVRVGNKEADKRWMLRD